MRKLRLFSLAVGLSAIACLLGLLIFTEEAEPNIYIKTFELFMGIISIPTLSHMIVEEINED